MMYIQEACRSTPVLAACDVAVVGGGIAGIAAALSAARAGAKTILLEQQYALGGLATIGLVTIYLPLCDGTGRQVSFGIAEELLRLAAATEGKDPVADWKDRRTATAARLECTYNPNLMALEAERLLQEAGVEILYGAQVCETQVQDGAIRALILETRSGRSAVSFKSVVDASGDGIVIRLSGEASAVFRQKNILAAWYYTAEDGKYRLHPVGACDDPDTYQEAEAAQSGQARYTGLDFMELSRFTQDAHRVLMEDYRKRGEPSDRYQLAMIASIPQIRMTRRLDGCLVPDEPDACVRYPDSIGMIGNWKRRGPVYELPFSCLHGRRIRNLLAAGRCISVTDRMWDNTRVIPACAVTGEAAGLAAAMGGDVTALHIAELQDALARRGVLLHEQQLPPR